MKKHFDVCPISHCDHFNCDLGQLEYDCPVCDKFVLTCEGWYDYNELKPFNIDCDQHKELVARYDKEEYEYYVELNGGNDE